MDDHRAGPSNRPNADARARASLLSATLTLSGELGYREATPELIATRAGQPVGSLYSHFGGRAECFAAAYAEHAEPLLARILTAARGGGDHAEPIRAGLGELFDFAAAEPLLARALIAEVYVAGGAAQAQHEQNLRRLSDAVAGTRRENSSSRHDPPPITAVFIVGGLEEVVRRRVGERRPELLREELPALVSFAETVLADSAADRGTDS